MARTSKTRIGGESGEQAERQIRAAESGAALKQRAHEGLMQQEAEGRREVLQGAVAVGEMSGRKAEMDQRREFEVGRQSLEQQGLDIEAAKAGYERQPGAPTSPLVSERRRKVEEEMARGGAQTEALYGAQSAEQQPSHEQQPSPEQQRQSEQMGRTDIERQGGLGGSFGLSAAGKAKMEIEATKAKANLIRAQAYQQQNQIAYAKALRQGNQEEMKAAKGKLMAPVLADRALESAFGSGDIKDGDWDKVETLIKEDPQLAQMNPELAAEVQSRSPGPALRRFISAKTAKSSLQFIVKTEGELPDKVDLNNPHIRPFVKAVEKVGTMIGMLEQASSKVGMSMTKWMGIRSLDDKERLQNKLAAMDVLSGTNRIKAPPTPAAPQPQLQQAQPQQQRPTYQEDMRPRENNEELRSYMQRRGFLGGARGK